MLYIFCVTAKEIVKKLEANGWVFTRINSSHHVFSKPGCRPVAVPFHGNKDIGNLVKRILKEAGIKE
jgi:predicted RNA binding protein YcfA (HicA-like mRNA interferase family)